jgi:hypothetical protein
MKIDLTLPNHYDFAFPWGNYTNKTAISLQRNVIFSPDGRIILTNKKERTEGWIKDMSTGVITPVWADYTCGLVITKEQFGFGTYHMKCQLPQFRGDWSAPFWWYDIIPPQLGGIQCESDFERFVKNACLAKYHLTCTYHDGDRKDIMGVKRQWTPMKKAELQYVWTSTYVQWWVNGKNVLEVHKSDVVQFPTKPMNIIINSGFGNWNIQDNKLEPLIITEFYKD